MKIIFCISAYRDPAHFGRLIGTLSRLPCEFRVHVDARVDQAPFEAQAAGLGARCRFIEPRVPVHWGGFSQVLYQAALLRAACAATGPADRVFFLSGADYPICSASEMLERIERRGDLLCGAPIHRNSPGRAADRYRLTNVRDTDLGARFLNRAVIAAVREGSRLVAGLRDRRLTVNGAEWQIYVGSSYFCLSADTARHALAQIDAHPHVLEYFRYCFVPEEMIWHTILMNSPYRDRFPVKEWANWLASLSETHYFYYKEHISVIDLENVGDAIASGKLFARKFATGRSDAALACLDGVWEAASPRDDREPAAQHEMPEAAVASRQAT